MRLRHWATMLAWRTCDLGATAAATSCPRRPAFRCTLCHSLDGRRNGNRCAAASAAPRAPPSSKQQQPSPASSTSGVSRTEPSPQQQEQQQQQGQQRLHSEPGPPGTSAPALVTQAEVAAAARRRGLHLSASELGPFYRIVCRERDEDGPIVGLTTGFVAPAFGLMHCDTLQVFTRGRRGEDGQRVRGGLLGLGLLLGGATFSFGLAKGCRKAEILAINDDDGWHERLVKYYSYFGFVPVCKVGGNGLSDLPHLLVWGGEGMRMDADVERMLRRWTPALRRAAAGSGSEASEG